MLSRKVCLLWTIFRSIRINDATIRGCVYFQEKLGKRNREHFGGYPLDTKTHSSDFYSALNRSILQKIPSQLFYIGNTELML